MFYIDTHFIRRREVALLHILPTLVVFVAFMVVTFISWVGIKANATEEQRRALVQRNEAAAITLRQRMESYEDILRGGAGLFNGSDMVERSEWQSYLSTYDINVRYPGIQGVGYTQIIPADQLQAHIDQIRASGYPNYSVFPGGDRSLYTSIVYIEPFSGTNLKAFGYDMYTDPIRHAAMDKARDAGDVVISGVVKLIQDSGETNTQPGFLMYMPLYSKGLQPKTIAERRSQLVAYVYAPFRSYDLINRTIENKNEPYGFQIFNLLGNEKQPVYETSNFQHLNKDPDRVQQITNVKLAGTTWQIVGVDTPQIISENVRTRLSSTLWGGFIFSFVVAGFIYLLLGNRAHALADKEERGIQEAKDELLALASHQLRTPATGVKQYVGMLREGFAGKLTPTQQRLIDKAYESNERQLNTINHMLFVARADAGQLKMDKAKINFSTIVKEVVDEHASVIAQRSQKKELKLPKNSVYVYGDKQYLRMSLENILSNASKYTKEGGRITISLRLRGQQVVCKVKDSGVGVAPEDLMLLFRKFSRIPNELTGQVSGSGIGLYLARKVVEAHGGSINFTSETGIGSTVTIHLPRVAKNATAKKR